MKDAVNVLVSNMHGLPERTMPTPDEQNLLSRGQYKELISGRLFSTKYRKTKADPETSQSINDYLQETIEKQGRIRMLVLMGGYKQARLDSSPYPEWAEIFNIDFMLQAAACLESIYPPGTEIVYRSDDVVATFLDNYRASDREKYSQRFMEMLRMFESHIPQNRAISLRYELTSWTSPEHKLFELMERLYPKYELVFRSLPENEQRKRTEKSLRNQQWSGEQDLMCLTDQQRIERAQWAAIAHDAFIAADTMLAGDYLAQSVSIAFRKGVPLCLHYGSCSSSTVQFWAGEGFVNIQGERFMPQILSYDQQSETQPVTINVEDPVFHSLNLHTIPVVRDFTRQ